MALKRRLFIILTVFCLFALGALTGSRLWHPDISQQAWPDNYRAGWNAAKQRLVGMSYYPVVNRGQAITTMVGHVVEVDGNRITIQVQPTEPLADPDLDTRIVNLDGSTKITRITQKDPEAYQQEMDEFYRRRQELKDSGARVSPLAQLPPMIHEIPAGADDIAFDQRIMVTAGEDIRSAKEFTAERITIQAETGPLPAAFTVPECGDIVSDVSPSQNTPGPQFEQLPAR